MKKLLLPLLLSVACATTQKPPATADLKPPAPAVKPVEAEPAPAAAQTQDDLESLLKGLAVRFEFDKYELTSESQKRLDLLADKMRANPQTHIRVAGNADELGTEEYNFALGQKRAEVVKTYLKTLGVEPTRVDTVSYGEERPVDPAHTPDAWSANRRSDIAKQ